MVLFGGTEYRAPPLEGFWGVPTATIDWCEENYVVSHYIAEFVNTTTNAAFILLAGYALMNVVRYQYEMRFLFCAIGFIIVGIGSWLFHMTLQYEYQLLDELPMIYATCIPCWSVFSAKSTKAQSRTIAATIVVGAATITAVYLRMKDPTLHQTAYGALNVVIIAKSVMQTRKYIKDPEARSHLNWTLWLGVSEFLLGWGIWNADIHLCTTWIGLRRYVGLPYGMLIEGHGWWHLLTGLGVYCYMVYLEYNRLWLTGRQEDYEYVWKWNFLPVVELKTTSKND